jgi:type III secretory pathway component EscT
LRVGVGLFLGLILAATFWGMMAAFAALTETVFDIWRQVRR